MTTDGMLEKVRQGYTLKEIGELAGLTHSGVNNRFYSSGRVAEYREAKAEYKRRRALMVSKELAKGKKVSQVAEEYGVTTETIYNYLAGKSRNYTYRTQQ